MTAPGASGTDHISTTFVVRVRREASGADSVVIELVRTGEKRRVDDVAGIGPVLTDMARRDRESLERGHTGSSMEEQAKES